MTRVPVRLIALLCGLAAPAWAFALDAAPLVCGIAVGYPPYQFQSASGDPAGIDAEITRLVFKELGQPFRFNQRSWDEVYLGLAHRTNESDLLCGAEINEERRALFTFSEPYYRRVVVIFVRADSPYRKLADLDRKAVTGDRGGVIETIINKNRVRVLATPSKEEAFRRLKTGEVAAVMAPLEVGNWLCRQSGLAVRTLPERDAGSPVAFAVAKGNTALADRISAALAVLKARGAIEAVLAKYK